MEEVHDLADVAPVRLSLITVEQTLQHHIPEKAGDVSRFESSDNSHGPGTEGAGNSPLKEQTSVQHDANGQLPAITNSYNSLDTLANQLSAVDFLPIKSELSAVEKDHADLFDRALAIIQMLHEETKAEAELLQDDLAKEQTELNRDLDAAFSLIALLVQSSVAKIELEEQGTIRISWAVVIVAISTGLLIAWFVTSGLMKPLNRLLSATTEVKRGNLDVNVPIATTDEVGKLSEYFNSMVAGIQEKDRIRATFGHFVDPRIVDRMLRSGAASRERVERKDMTVLFSDIEKFSGISEFLTPGGLVTLVNEYLTLSSEPILELDGVIDKFIGDAVVAFWGPPFSGEKDHATLACRAALEQFRQLEIMRRRLPDLLGIRKNLPPLNIRIGIATGNVLAGDIGSEDFRSFTVYGDTTTLAETLEGMNKVFGTRILISESTRELAGNRIETRLVDRIRVNGADQLMSVFELLSIKGELPADQAELRDVFEQGMAQYWEQSWSDAEQSFNTCLELCPEDGPSRVLLHRVQVLRAKPPESDWDGAWL